MFVVPLVRAVTKPVVLTLATLGVLDAHAFVVAGEPEPVSCEVAPIHKVVVPVIVGDGLTATVLVAVTAQPLLPVTVTV